WHGTCNTRIRILLLRVRLIKVVSNASCGQCDGEMDNHSPNGTIQVNEARQQQQQQHQATTTLDTTSFATTCIWFEHIGKDQATHRTHNDWYKLIRDPLVTHGIES
ncbi:hypothetical protein RDWZM_008684, partial [Blomia tropicalis]